MKVVIIDQKDIELKVENNSIKFDGNNIPFRMMELLIINHRTSFKSADILKITQANIAILIVSHMNKNLSFISTLNPKNNDLKLKQYQALNKSITIAQFIIHEKISSHTQQLKHHNIDINNSVALDKLSQAKEMSTVMGIEGSFARDYFTHYFNLFNRDLHKGIRTKRPPRDPVNAMLSYWYTLFYHIICVKLISFGFEPGIGYLHTPFRSHNALASDILELIRSDINEAVFQIFHNKIIVKEDFAEKNGVYLRFEARKECWHYFVELQDAMNIKLDKYITILKNML